MTQFRAPGRYVQGEGVLAETGDHLGPLTADAAVVAGGETALSTVETPLFEGIDAAGIDHRGTVRGIEESTDDRIGDIEARIGDADADLAIGVGGTTAIDAAKAAAFRTGTEFVAVPTLASADGPAAGLAVVYDGAGRPAGVETNERNPALVLVDTGVVADAPAHFLRSGIGNSLSTRFEAAASRSAGGTTIDGVALAETAAPLAEQVYDNIADVECSESSAAVETGATAACESGLMANEAVDVTPARAVEALETARKLLADA